MPKPGLQSTGHKEDLNGKSILAQEPIDVSFPKPLYEQMDFDKNYNYYHVMGHEEPHLVRRRKILAAHPEIKTLFGPDQASVWVTLALILAQFVAIQYCHELQWMWYIITAYAIGGTISHSSGILIHDLTHFTCFESLIQNKILAIFTNLPSGIPSAITFGRYHFDHHTYMNIKGFDPDLPSLLEVRFMNTPLRKFCFVFFQAFFYAIRPLVQIPKVPTLYEGINWLVVFSSDYLIYHTLGASALGWVLLSTFLGMGLHPCAGHTIAEHYEFEHRLETYDYLGPCNFFNMNIGYHTEHHDFPMIPWTRVPIVRKMAPEFYEHLPYHTSYVKVIMLYIFEGYMGPFSRIIRKVTTNKD